MRIETRVVQTGNRQDPATGAVSAPIYHATTFAHPAPGQSTGYDYTRTANPTRTILEQAIAELESGTRGFAFASGMAAVHCVLGLLSSGDHVVVSDDLYGGTYRLLERLLQRYRITATYVDMGNLAAVESAIAPATKALFIETPTNPTMKITDISACARLAHEHGLLCIVDNTFMTPIFQRPLELGADIVVHSGTKYLGGHNDVLAGLIAVKEAGLAEQLTFLQNSIGAVLGPQDAWLMVRGMKTLALRMERHEANARRVGEWLNDHGMVASVYYPGLAQHPGRIVHESQCTGYGGMVSFEVVDERLVKPLLSNVRLITFAESLGGVESLITYPTTQTHADIPQEVREAVGVTSRLLRLSVGVEHVEDIISDLAQALAIAATQLPFPIEA